MDYFTFVNYLLHDEEAVMFRKFMKETKIPEEHFVVTLFNRTGVCIHALLCIQSFSNTW